ncbi:MAG: N-acetylmuramoyl-L-alanine amidase [Balneolaceae bacterium]|nr:N-acetylmuramoyl-L-alanine amidase [Balneolaceae bacterium]
MKLITPLLSVFLFLISTTQTVAQDWLIERSEWGSTDSLVESNRHTIEYITIHHGGEIFEDEKNVYTYLKNLQSWSRSARGWMDVPYHYIIDRQGRIFEGRPLDYRGDTNTAYDPTGHALIVLLGNFEEQEVREKQKESLKTVTEYLAKWKSVPASKIKTHKDYAETLCPGKKLSEYLATNEWQTFLNDLESQ